MPDVYDPKFRYTPEVCRICGEPRGLCPCEQSLIETLCPDCSKRLGAPLPDDINENLICDACGKSLKEAPTQ